MKQISKAFKSYERSYKIGTIDLKDPLTQLESSKSSIKDFFKEIKGKIKGFKHQ